MAHKKICSVNTVRDRYDDRDEQWRRNDEGIRDWRKEKRKGRWEIENRDYLLVQLSVLL